MGREITLGINNFKKDSQKSADLKAAYDGSRRKMGALLNDAHGSDLLFVGRVRLLYSFPRSRPERKLQSVPI
jgi:hypothetical protein